MAESTGNAISRITVTDLLNLSPPSGTYVTTQHFDPTAILSPGPILVGGQVLFDDADVTDIFLGCGIPGTLATGGQTLRCPDVAGSQLGAGIHAVAVSLACISRRRTTAGSALRRGDQSPYGIPSRTAAAARGGGVSLRDEHRVSAGPGDRLFRLCELREYPARIHKNFLSRDPQGRLTRDGETTHNIRTINFAVHGPWVLMNDGLLWNTGHNRDTEQVCILRQEAEDSYPDLNCFIVSNAAIEQFAYFSHAKFAGGFYYSEFDPSGNRALAYRVVETATGFSQTRPRILIPQEDVRSAITAKAFTFLEDTVRVGGQIFAFVTDPNWPDTPSGTLWVACSTDGRTFTLKDSGFSLDESNQPRYGPTGSVATVWRTTPTSVAWGHTRTAKFAPSHAIVSRSTASCR